MREAEAADKRVEGFVDERKRLGLVEVLDPELEDRGDDGDYGPGGEQGVTGRELTVRTLDQNRR